MCVCVWVRVGGWVCVSVCAASGVGEWNVLSGRRSRLVYGREVSACEGR